MTKKKRNSDENVTQRPKRKRRESVPASVPVVQLEPANAVMTPGDRHRVRMQNFRSKRPPVTEANKHELIELMRAGEVPTDICDNLSMPPYSAFMRECAADDAFAQEYNDAYRVMAEMILIDAKRFVRDSAETGNLDQMKIADMYLRSMISSLEKMAPRDFGPLIKHAGSEGGPIQVQVINYSKQLPNAE